MAARSLAAGYGRAVVEGVELCVGTGELVLLRGANGAGKSTLLRCLAGVLSPMSGEVTVAGRPMAAFSRRELARKVAYLPQQTDASALLGTTVRDVVALGRLSREGWLRSAGMGHAATDPAVESAIEAMGLAELSDRDATGLSGGESRRMYVAACLAQGTEVLLLDEPFNQLDAEGRERLAAALRTHLAHGGAAVVATHGATPLDQWPGVRTMEVRPATEGTGAAVAGSAQRKTVRMTAGLAGALAAVAFLAWTLCEGLDGLPPEQARNVLRMYRFPRVLTAFFTGGVLSVAGWMYQTVFRNPMASPYTLGTASGAAFGAYLAVALGGLPLPVAAFAGALLSIGVVRVCAGRGGAARLLLSGIACGFLFSAASMLVQYRLNPEQTYATVHWGFGSIVAAKPGPLALLGVAFALALLSGLAGRPLDAMLAGDESAMSFGVPVRRVRTGVFLFAALLTACAVSVCGPVAFVGLVVPHLVRLTMPGRHARTLPLAAVFGGLFLAVCDTLPRVLFGGLTPPVGVVTAVVGAPVLLMLLRRK